MTKFQVSLDTILLVCEFKMEKLQQRLCYAIIIVFKKDYLLSDSSDFIWRG